MQCDRQTWGLCGKGAMDTKGGARGWGRGVSFLSQGSGKAGGVQKKETEEKEKRLQFPGSEAGSAVRVCADCKGWRLKKRAERIAH